MPWPELLVMSMSGKQTSPPTANAMLALVIKAPFHRSTPHASEVISIIAARSPPV
jgi:hypothetical protein